MKVVAAALASLVVLVSPFYAHSAGVGDKVPAFSMKDIKGNTVTLDSLNGKVVFLDFWATWCGPCKEELPALDAIYQKYAKDGLEIVAVSVDKSEENVAEFLAKKPVSFTVLTDKTGKLASSFSLVGMPTAFIIGKDGVIVHKHAGFSKSFLSVYEKEIVELLKKP